MKVDLPDRQRFRDELFRTLGVAVPKGGALWCYWAATYGAHTLGVYVSRATGEVEMLHSPRGAEDFIYGDWAGRRGINAELTYDGWLGQADRLIGLSWNWGWAKYAEGGRSEMHLFDDTPGGKGLPSHEHVDAWLKERFGNAKIIYPKSDW